MHTDIAWYGAGWTNICQAFFSYSPTTRAATMAEEWLHQFGDVLHAGTPAIHEADNYAAFLRARYLT